MVCRCQTERFKAVAVRAAELGPTFRGEGAKRLFAFQIWCQAYCAYSILCVCDVSSQLDMRGIPRCLKLACC